MANNNNAGNNGTGAYRLPALTAEQAAAMRRGQARENARRSRNLYVETSKGYMQMERQKALEALARKLTPYKASKNNRNAAMRALQNAQSANQKKRKSNKETIQAWSKRLNGNTTTNNRDLYKKMRVYYVSELNRIMGGATKSRGVKRAEAFASLKRALGSGAARAGIYSAYGARGLAKAAAAPVRGAALTGRASTGLLQRMKIKAFAMRKKRAPSNYTASSQWKAYVLKLRREQEAANNKVNKIESSLKRAIISRANSTELTNIRLRLNGAKSAAARARELANNARRRKTIPALFPGAPAIPKSGNGNGVRRSSSILAEVPNNTPGITRGQSVRQLAARFEGAPVLPLTNLGGRGPAPVTANVFNNARSNLSNNNNVASMANVVKNNAALAALQSQAVPGPRRWFRNPLARRRN